MVARDILDPNPFANPVFAEKGNKTRTAIFTLMGFALHRWEHCDMAFASMYAALICPERSNHTLMRAYGTITAPATKKTMAWEACDAYFGDNNPVLRAETRHLLNLYGDASARRNEIAHALVLPEEVGDAASEWFLVPPIFATRKNKMNYKGPKYRLSSVEITRFAKCFSALADRAWRNSQSIRESYWSSQGKHG